MESNDFPLSHGQKALWFLQRLRPEAAAWNIAAAARVRGRLDAGRLRRAFERLTERHDALRLSFHDGPVQRLHPEARVDFREEAWEEGCLEREAERPFDLERDPLLRVRLLRAGGDDVLLLVIHHLVADLGSLAVIVRELGPLYDGTFDEPPPTSYSAFVERPLAERHWEHWRKRLAGELPVCELPADRPRPAVRTFRGGSCTRRLALAAPRATLFPFLLAGLDVLLHRASGQTDLLVGSPTSGRLSRELDGTVGYLVNPVVLRSDLSGSPTFGQLLEQLRGVVLGALRHQEYPFPLLVERLQPERDPARPPVFQVMLAFQRAHLPGTGDLAAFSLGIEGAEVRTGPLVLESLALERRFCELDLELVAAETSRGLELALTFNADLFEPVTARRLLGHLATLLQAAAADPEIRIGELPLLSQTERHHLLREGGDASGPPREATVSRLFEEQAARAPDALALLSGDLRLTYAELDTRADALADRLLGLGARPETCVAVLAERSPELVVALLAILKSGAAYAPLDPELPSERLASLLEDLEPVVVLTREELLATPAVPAARPRPAPLSESLAYVLHTSGSTGRPKPVGVSHAALAEHVLAAADRLEMSARDRALVFASPAFDVSLEQILTALVRGAALVLRGAELWPAADFSRIAGELGLTVAELPTAYWRQWVREPSAAAPPALRLVTAGGEAMPVEEARIWLDSPLSGARLLNAYGPTEGVITATTLQVDAASASRPGPVPLGRPLPGRRAFIVDLHGQPQLLGAAGELCLGGSALARGYPGRPDLTAERFVPDPGSPEPGGRLYRTGDLARRLPDGTLEHLGRLDRQLKVRGVRIEPGEIEAALLRHPAVREAAVDLRPGPAGEPVLAAWVAGISPMPDLRPHLRRLLPGALVPSVIATVPALPLTAGGKVDRKALVSEALPPRREEPGGAGTPFEDLLAGIWGEVLGRQRVLPGDDFFELGGHSLLATQVVSRVRKVFGVELPLRALFEEPTLAGLARRVASARQEGPAAPPIVPVPRDRELPLSFAQQRLWFLDRLSPEAGVYRMFRSFRLAGPLNLAALRGALSEVVRRHESLRTCFPLVDGTPAQRIAGAAPAALPLADLSGLPAEARSAELRRLARAESDRRFDLERGPLLRALLVRSDPEAHALLLSGHHTVCDGWSAGILMRELESCHGALSRGRAPDLPELPVQYADFAVWQRRWLQGETLERELSYWRRQLAGMPEVLELPTDRPRPAVQSFRCGRVEAALPADLAGALAGLGRRAGSTLFMTLLAGLDALLHRCTAQEAIAVGTPIANRRYAELEGLVGSFANTLVLGARVEGALPFRDLLERVREAALGAYAHQDLPFESLVEALGPRRDLAWNPLFQVLFGLHNLPPSSSRSAGLETWPLVREDAVARFDLALDLEESPAGLRGAFEYAADLFDRTTVARLAGHLQTLLAGALAEPDRRIGELPLLSAPERRQLLEWSGSPPEGAPAECLHERFELWASRRPEATAVACGAERLTYGELDRRAGALAWRLRKLGVGPETPVGVYLERSVELVAALLGVLKAGGAYVPLDPASPQQRVAWILESARVQVVVTRGALARQLSGLRVSWVDLDEEVPAPEVSPVSGVTSEHTAYVIFTSGSTGRPKGVQVAHGSVVHLLETARPRFGFGERDVWTVVHSFAFDFSVWEIWGALALGGRLVVVPLEVARSPAELAGLLGSEAVTVLNQTPSALRQLAESVDRLPASLRLIVCGGEALPRELVPRLADWGVPVWNFYGPTEATVWAAAGPVPALEEHGQGAVPLGRPLPDARLLVLGPGLELLPAGVAGELCIGGPGLARGYVREPALTAAAFVPDPFSDEPGERLYRTGDTVRCLGDGTLEFLGRIDQQVKLRGVRIEPGEVEAALAAHPGVREAVVALLDGQLAAWWSGDPAAAPELRQHLRQRLPEIMVPALFHRLDALPLTSHGKIDRRALPDPVPPAEEDGAPLGPVEETVAEIWAGVLGVDRIGRHRGFFDLGGHSLLATRVMSRITQAFRTDLPLRALFEAPTVEGLARLVSAAGRDPIPMPAWRRVPRGQPLAPSFAQERLWVMDRLVPDSPLYNVFQAVDLGGPLDETALERAFAEVTQRHETLRTRFALVHGRPMQIVEPHRPRPLSVVDLRGLPPRCRQEEADRLAREEARRPFDLLRGPLLRFGLLRLGEESSRLLLNLHHIVCDGWSLDLLAREAGALYRGQALPELPFQYADYADWQRRWPTELLDRQLAWWRERLAGLADLEIPTDFPRPPVQTFRGGQVLAPLPPELFARLRTLARERHATLFMLFLAAWQVLLHRITGQEDVAVGAPVANRNWPEVEGLVGFFANNLVLRADLSGEPGFAEALERVRETALAAFSRQDLPFERLVTELGTERDLSRSPLFQVVFSFQEAPPALEPGGQALFLHTGTSKFDLGLQVSAGQALAEYAADLFDAATVRRWLGCLRGLLEGVAASPETRISELPLLSPAERQQLLLEWNDTGGATEATIHRLVEEQAARTPDAVAVLFGDERLTYAELNLRADRLADRLLGLGVRPEACVALLAERSPETIVALLAILKAGAAYAPLDPELPAERLAFLLEDLRPPVVLAQERLRQRLPASAAAVALLDEDGGESPGSARPAVAADSLAYVLHTSGSTGRPKGVAAVHRGVVRLVREGGFADLGPACTLLQLAPLSFDASTLEIWGALANGARLVVLPPGVPTFEALARTVALQGVDTLWLTAALFHQVVDEKPSLLLPVHQLLAGGDVLSPPHVRKALDLRPGGVVINGYGPTEGTTFTCCRTLRSAEDVGEPVSLGRPIGGTRVHVLDRNLRPVPLGVPGELFIGGDGLARGYHRRPDLTAERFLPDPLRLVPGGRLYRSGDLARRLPDGNLQFLGRIDRQVKVRGIRIELEEVEAALAAHPGVREAVVALRDGRLTAWWTGDPGAAPELRDHLLRRLPLAMVPAFFQRLDALPLTPHGKLDRRALPDPPDPIPAAEEDGAPLGPVEATVAEIWAGMLGVDRIGRHRDFFELGGHSLLATRVMSRVNEAFGADLPLRALFEAPTVAGLARLVSAAGRDPIPMPAWRRVPRGQPLAPSFAQERLWVMDRLVPDSPLYNVFQALDLGGPLDETALERAFAEVAQRHETLRTRFALVQGRPMQVVEPHRPRPLPVVDLRGLPPLLRQQEADRLAREEARRPFDLLRGPLLRLALLRLGNASRLLLSLHHIVCDGWSLDLLAREAGDLYRGQTLPELPFQYADYADWQRRWPAELLDGQLAWWRERLAGLAGLEIPADFPSPPVRTFRGGQVLSHLPPDLSARLRTLARERHATLFMLLLAAWQVLLHRITGREDVAVGAPVANRNWPEVEGLVGFFANNLVLRADLSGEPGFAEAFERVRETALAAFSRQDLPFERLAAELAPQRDLSRSPLFQVVFSFQEAPPTLDLGGQALALHTGTSKFDLGLHVDRETLEAEYAADLFEAATVRRWLGHLRALLEGAVDSPQARISGLPLLSRAERQQLLLEWNDTGPGGPEATVHRLFEEQAARTPGAVAVLFGGERLTYAELDARADALADRLLELGVQPEACVALLAERSPEMVVALLAILKSGAAYAPLDPELPDERLALLLKDLRPPVVLAQERLRQRLPDCVAAVALLDEDGGESPRSARPAVTADSLAYVLHTSGSSGRPKPVGVTHAALAEHVLAAADLLELSDRDRVLFFASPAFDVSLEQLLPALIRGATVVPRGPELWPPADFSRIAGRLGLTVADLPTSYWRQWLAEPSCTAPPALRLVLAGGEAMPAEEARRWLRSPLAGARLLNAYGPTEGVVTATVQEVDAASASRPGAVVALGRPLPGRRACVLDRHGQLQPPGVPGELCLGGRPLARGYLGRPDLTAERFVPDPFGEGERLYRTGDLARRLPDGNLQFLGRTDRQVKVRGFRIELEEIEAVLRSHPGVREAAAAARDGRLVAWYAPGPEPGQVRTWLRGKLPEAMVPAALVPLDALPLTPNGKIDRRALPAPVAGPVAPAAAPRTPLESLVAGVCSEVLGIGEVPRDVSFFDLGGNSLLATQVVTLLQDVLPVELSLRQVMERPTVASLAEIIEEESRALAGPERLAMDEILAELERSL